MAEEVLVDGVTDASLDSDNKSRSSSQLEARDATGRTLLILAGEGNFEALISLIDLGANVNAQDFNGLTALMIAVKGGNIDCINVLLQKGEAKTHYQDNFGSTVLHLAIQSGCNLHIIKTLVSNFADLEIKNSIGQKPIDIVPGYDNGVKRYLLSSPIEMAGCLFKALGKEFEDLKRKAEEMLLEAANFSSSFSNLTVQSSSRRRNGARLSSYRGIYMTGQGSISEIATQISLSELISRFAVLRVALQHQVSELATDYGDRDYPIENMHYLSSGKSSHDITDESVGKHSDSVGSKRVDLSNIPTERIVMVEIQWCLEALSEICRIFSIIFPHAKSLLEINTWSLLQEEKQGNMTNWVTLPLKETKMKKLPSLKGSRVTNFMKDLRVKPLTSLRASGQGQVDGKALAEIEHLLSSSRFLHEISGMKAIDNILPKLSIQNILFSQMPELYEQHLTAINKQYESIENTTKIKTCFCVIC